MAPETLTEGIAIVGADCCFANGDTLDAFWTSCMEGQSGVREISRWRPDLFRDPAGGSPRVTRGALLDRPPDFPWQRFRIPPRQVERMHPMDRLLMRTAVRAVEHAGYGPARSLPRDGTAIFVGSMGPMLDPTDPRVLGFRRHEVVAALEAALSEHPVSGEARASLATWVQDALSSGLNTEEAGDVSGSASIVAGRIANLLDLRGMHMAVDAEGASALAALELAARGLRRADFDVALVAAISPWLSPLPFEVYGRLGLLADGDPEVGTDVAGPPRPWAGPAPCRGPGEGLILGEGGGALLLKRLGDALEGGDRVLAVIRGVGGASHGRRRMPASVCADTLVRAFHGALAEAGWSPASVGYVECHGGGVPEWDDAERTAVCEVFGSAPRLGSAQPLAGYALSASGLSGLLQAVLAVSRGWLPRSPSPEGVATGWPEGPRRAGVTAWGLGGYACHVLLEEAAPPPAERPARSPTTAVADVALMGMGGVFPGAPDVPSLWNNILEKVCAVGEVPAHAWDPSPFYHPDRERPGIIYSRLGAFIDRVDLSGGRYPLAPRHLERLDRSQLYALEAAGQALRDAALAPEALESGRVGVVLADMDWRASELSPALWLGLLGFRERLGERLRAQGLTPDAVEEVVQAVLAHFRQRHPSPTEDTLPGQLGCGSAARVAHALDLSGPTFVVESTCASSLAALYASIVLLRSGRCDTVLTGGVFANMTPEYFLANCSFRALSPQGIFPFDARADGFVIGEGAGVVVAQRREDVPQGAVPYSIVRGIGGSSDGKGRSILAPNEEGQVAAMRQALAQARVPPGSVSFIECHGAGTPLGDATEVGSYARVYGRSGRTVGLTAIKSMIGHLSSAAGIAGVIKTSLALRHRVLPPSLGFQVPNEKVPFAEGPFEVITEPAPWEAESPRRAAVSAFGLGGSNFHIILEEPAAPAVSAPFHTQARIEEATLAAREEALPVLALREEAGVAQAPVGAVVWWLIEAARRHAPDRPVVALEHVQVLRAASATGLEPLPIALRVDRGAGEELLAVSVGPLAEGHEGRPYARARVRLGPVGEPEEQHLGLLRAEDAIRLFDQAVTLLPTGAWAPEVLGLQRLEVATEAAHPRLTWKGREVRVSLTSPSCTVPVRARDIRYLLRTDGLAAEPFRGTGVLPDRERFPLIDSVARRSAEQVQLVRTVTLEREPYLLDHQLDGVPVIPGACHFATLAEGALLARPTSGLVSLEDVDIPVAARVYPSRELLMRVLVEGTGPVLPVRLVSDFVDPAGRVLVTDRVHATGRVRVGPPRPATRAPMAADILRWLPRQGLDFKASYEDPDGFIGPMLRTMRWVRQFGEEELLACIQLPVREGLLGHVRAPRFCLNPFLLDGVFQAAGLFATRREHRASLPAGATSLRVYRQVEEHERLHVYVRARPTDVDQQAHFDLQVVDESGRLVWDLERYRAYLLWPLSEAQVAKLERTMGPSAVRERMEVAP